MSSAADRKKFQNRLKRFRLAAGEGDLSTLRQIMREDSKVLESDHAMMEACLHGQAKAVTLLLKAGASAEAIPGPDGSLSRRPLTRVLRRRRDIPWTEGHAQTLDLLLDHGVTTSSESGWMAASALAAAASADCREGMEILLERMEGEPDFFDSAVLADLDAVTLALSADKSLAMALSSGGATALQYCAMSRLGVADKDAASRLGAIARLLIMHGAPLEPSDDHVTYSAMRLASRSGNQAVMSVLLEHGANAQDALELALDDQNMAILDLLAEHASVLDLDYRMDNKLANPAINDLIRYGRLQSATWLLEQGANPNLTDLDGMTALHYAARRGVAPELVSLLIDHGADPSSKDESGKTPLDHAQERKKSKVVAVLEAT